jgi:ComF family protein
MYLYDAGGFMDVNVVRQGSVRLPTLYKIFSPLIVPLRDFLFPPQCFSCNKRLAASESRICSDCWDSLTIVDRQDHTAVVLKNRFASTGLLDDFWSCYYFEHNGTLQSIVHLLKYSAMTILGEELGKRLGERVSGYDEIGAIDCIVPVPLHQIKLRERGYNQSDYVCRGLGSIIDRPVMASLIVRVRNTVSQTHLTAEERARNMTNAFEVRASQRRFVEGKSFLIVDDVITTGSTIQAVARALRDCGATRVFAASVGIAKLNEAEQ